jgi:hypothetical protein
LEKERNESPTVLPSKSFVRGVMTKLVGDDIARMTIYRYRVCVLTDAYIFHPTISEMRKYTPPPVAATVMTALLYLKT